MSIDLRVKSDWELFRWTASGVALIVSANLIVTIAWVASIVNTHSLLVPLLPAAIVGGVGVCLLGYATIRSKTTILRPGVLLRTFFASGFITLLFVAATGPALYAMGFIAFLFIDHVFGFADYWGFVLTYVPILVLCLGYLMLWAKMISYFSLKIAKNGARVDAISLGHRIAFKSARTFGAYFVLLAIIAVFIRLTTSDYASLVYLELTIPLLLMCSVRDALGEHKHVLMNHDVDFVALKRG